MKFTELNIYFEILSIPFFGLLVYYFFLKFDEKTILEYSLQAFSIIGLLASLLFSSQHLLLS
jgi:hypothetical protein